MANIKNFLYRNRQRRLEVSPPYKAGTEATGAGKDAILNESGSGKVEDTGFSIDRADPTNVEQEGPENQIIAKMPTKIQRRFKQINEVNKNVDVLTRRLVATIWQMRPWREKSEIEKEREAEIKARKKMQNTLRREAKLFTKRASNAYARMGLCYIPPIHQRSLINGIKKVRFNNVVAERNAIWLQIETDRLPWGVDILRCIHDEGVLTNLSASLRHHVQGKYDVERGAWLCIERGRGVRGIPQEVSYEKMYSLIPDDSNRLTVPFGETVNSRRLYRTLRDFPHLLIAGSTGQGKTSFLNVILATLIKNNTPDDLKLVLVDLKNGIEFDMYRGVPHLWKMGGKGETDEDEIAPEGIVGRNDKVLKLMYRLKVEGERRLNTFRKMGITNIDEYNRGKTAGRRMSRVVVLIDEWARVALSPDGKKADTILSEITATYRAVGFHIILATQTPITRVISTLIKTNFNARLAFGVPHNTASMVILDSIRAKGLATPGRAIFQYGTQVIETQVPFIKKSELTAILDEARSDGGRVEDELSMLEVFRYSLKSLDGSLASQRLWEQFQQQIGKGALEQKLKTMDDLLVDIDGVEYIVRPPYGSVPRRLEEYKEVEPITLPA